MPNFISNALVVTKGDPQTVWDQLAGTDILGRPTVFDPSRIIPVQNKSEQVWSEANTEAWGTKWVDEAEIIQQNRRLIFTSPWTCPYKVICKIIAMFPEHEFEFGCSDDYAGECYEWTGVNGQISNCKMYNYDLRRDNYQIFEADDGNGCEVFEAEDADYVRREVDYEDVAARIYRSVDSLLKQLAGVDVSELVSTGYQKLELKITKPVYSEIGEYTGRDVEFDECRTPHRTPLLN